jgi:tetratricopeptide (TPR) repeat protein
VIRGIRPWLLSLTLLAVSCKSDRELTTSSEEAARLYREGTAQYERFYYDEARTTLQKSLALDSTFAMARIRLAILDASLRDETGSRTEAARALKDAMRATRRERLFVSMWYYRLTYDNSRAMAAADSLASLFPDQKEVYLFRGQILEQNKNFEAAIKSYQRAIDVDTGYALAAMTLGYAYSMVGDGDKAVAMMQRYIRLAPKEPDPLASYADILVRAGRYDEAESQYRASLGVKSDYWYSIRELGSVAIIKGKLREGERLIDSALTVIPGSNTREAERRRVHAALDMQRRDYSAAVTGFSQAVTFDSTSFDAAAGLAIALSKSGNVEAGKNVLARVFREFKARNLLESQAMASYHTLRSMLFMNEGKLDSAASECDSALGYSSTFYRSTIYRQQAEVFLRGKAYEQALAACEEALAPNRNNPEVLLTLVRIYTAKGDVQLAADIGGRLLELWSEADQDYANKREVLSLLHRTR